MPETITLTIEEYEDLIDAREAAVAMRDVASGALQTLSGEEVDAYLAAPTPLAFWRGHRGMNALELAQAVGVSAHALGLIENGGAGDATFYARAARALRVRMEDLVVEE